MTTAPTTAASAVAPGSARAWLLAARPQTLPAAAAPVLVGTACAAAAGGFRAGPAAAALLGALLIQIGTNLWNDACDFERGTDGADRVGPRRAAQSGLLSPRQLRAGTMVAFAGAMAAGVYLTAIAGWPIVIIGLASLAAGLAYTGGPFPLGYHGLGDPFVFLFFGLVAVAGTAFVQVGAVPALAWWAAVPVGCLATAIIVVNNLRDRAGDARAGKRTLAVRLGSAGARVEYAALIAAGFAVPVVLVAAGLASPWALLPLASAPLAVGPLRTMMRGEGAALGPALPATARLLMVHAALLALGLTL
jgi:1,4-dihydroxy-2-naphthoate polyprenyltransferase